MTREEFTRVLDELADRIAARVLDGLKEAQPEPEPDGLLKGKRR